MAAIALRFALAVCLFAHTSHPPSIGRSADAADSQSAAPRLISALALPHSGEQSEVAQITSRFNDTLSAMASALGENNPESFLEQIDKDMPGYGRLKSNVEALTAQADVHSGIDQIDENGDEVTVNWEMRIEPHGDVPNVESERRSETLHLKFVQDGKHWKVAGLDHIEFFEPPRTTK